MKKGFDVIVIGAGSVGVPVALYLTLEGLKVLVVDQNPSAGQGENKSAIGGVRATHSDKAKISLCKESLEIFSQWEDRYCHKIGWKKGGYCFVAYRPREENMLKALLPAQQSYGLNIEWIDTEQIQELIPGICSHDLRGGTYSPEDGQVSPLLVIDAMFCVAQLKGCTFLFNERVTGIVFDHNRIRGIKTNKNRFSAPVVVNAAGAHAREVGELTGIEIPVIPESHEAGISAPLEQFLQPLVVDLRPGPEGKTANFYFGQTLEGPIIFCYTPKKPFKGTNREPTSEFLPILAGRMITLVPGLNKMLIRRVWRGLYPMIPDGLPICGAVKELEGMYLAVGMCGQGFMMGPGVGRNIAHLIIHGHPLMDPEIFDTISLYRDIYGTKIEKLK